MFSTEDTCESCGEEITCGELCLTCEDALRYLDAHVDALWELDEDELEESTEETP